MEGNGQCLHLASMTNLHALHGVIRVLFLMKPKGDTSTIGNLGILAITLRPGKIPGTKTDILKQKEFIRSYVKMGMIYMKFMHLWLPALFLFLNHTILINRILGYENRVAMTNRAKHDPDPESNEILYNFFEWYLCPTS